jgi:3-oxoacyl-[acyl-carrier-protein] synthase-1
MCTPLGLTARATQAAFRAGLLHFRETEFYGQSGEPLRASRLDLLPPDFRRNERVLALAKWALDDLACADVGAPSRRDAAFIALPGLDIGSGPSELDQEIAGLLAKSMPSLLRYPAYFRQGRSAFFFALEAALAALAAGTCDRALVGAVDSLCAPGMLRRLDSERRILGPVLDGIIPGEGASFGWLVGQDEPQARRDGAIGTLLCATTGVEARHLHQDQPNTAQALSAVLQTLRNHPAGSARRADLLYTCETGERFFAQEFIAAYLRNTAIMPEPFSKCMAAEGFGDLGAAAGGVMFALGVQVLARSRRGPRPHLLLCGSSDDGPVGACLVEGRSRVDEDS